MFYLPRSHHTSQIVVKMQGVFMHSKSTIGDCLWWYRIATQTVLYILICYLIKINYDIMLNDGICGIIRQ